MRPAKFKKTACEEVAFRLGQAFRESVLLGEDIPANLQPLHLISLEYSPFEAFEAIADPVEQAAVENLLIKLRGGAAGGGGGGGADGGGASAPGIGAPRPAAAPSPEDAILEALAFLSS